MFDRKKIISIGIVAAVVVITFSVGLFITDYLKPENVEKREIKAQITKKIGNIDITIDTIMAESQGWYLVRLVAEAKDKDYNSPSMAILHKEGGKFVLKFGPGTSFDDAELDKAGVPNAIYSRNKPYVADPIVKLLPYRTNNYAVQEYPSKTLVGSVDKKKPLDLLIYEFPRTSVYATPQRRAQYTAEALQWIQNQGLNPDNYTLIPRGAYDIDP